MNVFNQVFGCHFMRDNVAVTSSHVNLTADNCFESKET